MALSLQPLDFSCSSSPSLTADAPCRSLRRFLLRFARFVRSRRPFFSLRFTLRFREPVLSLRVLSLRAYSGAASFGFSVVFHSSVRFSPSLASLRSVFCRRLSSSDLRSARATCRRSPRTPVPLALLVACLPSAALRSSRPLSLCLLAVVAIIVAIIGRRSYIDLEPNTKPKPDRRRSGRHPRLPPQGIRRSPSI